MEKLFLFGACERTPQKLHLNLPNSKWFKQVQDGGSKFMTSVSSTEGNPYPELLISRAVLRKKFETNHVEPFVEVDGKLVHVPETLKDLLHHPFPRNQGPLRLPLDSNNIVTECKRILCSHTVIAGCTHVTYLVVS